MGGRFGHVSNATVRALCPPLQAGFAATDAVHLARAPIGSFLNCTGGTFTNPGRKALTLERAEVSGEVIFHPARRPAGSIDLRIAQVGAWYDAADTRPCKGDLLLNGLTYAHIDADPPIPVRRRLAWLRRDGDGFVPQPYGQLAAV